MFEFLPDWGFLTWWTIFICSLMASVIVFAFVMIRREEKVFVTKEILAVVAARQIWVMPSPPTRPTPPTPISMAPTFGGGFDGQQMQYESSMRLFEQQMADFNIRQEIAYKRHIDYGEPLGYVDHYEIEFDGYPESTIRAELGHSFGVGDKWRVEFKKGVKSGRIYSIQLLERVKDSAA